MLEGVETLEASLTRAGDSVPVRVVGAAAHALFVEFRSEPPEGSAAYSNVKIRLEDREIELGKCLFFANGDAPQRRKTDPPEPPGHGQLVFVEEVYDFSRLLKRGAISDLTQKTRQLGLVWKRKQEIRPTFRDFTADLNYDLQVYRSLFDSIDRALEAEDEAVTDAIHHVALQNSYPDFKKFFDQRLRELESLIQGFTRQQHERHGFYFRKQVWDLVLSSRFMHRTNLKPRGYAGDSVMMRMIYNDRFEGDSIFAKMMHRHPLQSDAAQAVRNRRKMIPGTINALRRSHNGAGPFRVMSVACGPTWELRDLFASADDATNLEVTLLDQDSEALGEAEDTVDELSRKLGRPIAASLVRDSVRTMLRTPELSTRWGRFHCLYSMGLFDYLTSPVAKAVLAKLYEVVEPGGVLLIGNFHPQNRTRVYMDYWMDWPLFYRTKEELRELAEGLPGAELSVEFEETGSQMFLAIRKAG